MYPRMAGKTFIFNCGMLQARWEVWTISEVELTPDVPRTELIYPIGQASIDTSWRPPPYGDVLTSVCNQPCPDAHTYAVTRIPKTIRAPSDGMFNRLPRQELREELVTLRHLESLKTFLGATRASTRA